MFFITTFVVIIVILVFVVTHLRPLTQEEIVTVANKRRNKAISQYFAFDVLEAPIDLQFKKKMNSNGKLYEINEPLRTFPSFVAALLKYKKHEWIVVGIEGQRQVRYMWVNKGPDGTQVGLKILFTTLLALSKKNKMNSILVFHNHPNPNPQKMDLRCPSKQDRINTIVWAFECNQNGFNMLDFVCERGRFRCYNLSPAAEFMPLNDFISAVMNDNNRSRYGNLILHLERIWPSRK